MIIDDGSKDKTADIANEYIEKYPGTFKLISKPNGGWGSTLNSGMKAAAGKYFKQLDGDDYYSHENLPLFLDFLEKTDSDAVLSPFACYEDESGATFNVLARMHELREVNGTVDIKELGPILPAMHALTVKTEVLKKADFTITEHCFYTDLEFCVKAYNNCSTLSYFDLPIYMYRLGREGQSMSVSGIRKHYTDHLKMLFTCLKYMDEEVSDSYKKTTIKTRLRSACEMQYAFFYALECNKKQREELKNYDQELRRKYPELSDAVSGARIKLMRKVNYALYWLIGHQATSTDKKKKLHIFEGN